MSTTARPAAAMPGRSWADRLDRRTALRLLGRAATRGLVVTGIALLALTVGLALYGYVHTDRIYEGVAIAGVRVGGMTEAEARSALETRFAGYAAKPLTLVVDGKTFSLAPAAAGATLDSAGSVERAFAYGRAGSFWVRSRAWARAILDGRDVPPRIEIDQTQLEAELQALAPRIIRPPTDARVEMDATGQPALVPDVPGIGLNLTASDARIADEIGRLGTDAVPLMAYPVPAAVPAERLAPGLTTARTAVSAGFALSTSDQRWTIGPVDLKRIVSVSAANGAVAVDQEALRTVVQGIAGDLDHPSHNAGITVDERHALVVVPGTNAVRVDVDQTVADAASALRTGSHGIGINLRSSPPTITDAEARAGAAAAEQVIAGGVDLTWNGGKARLGRDDLLAALVINARPGEARPFAVDLDRDVLADKLGPVADQVNVAVSEPRFRLVKGKITLVADGQEGRSLDVPASVGAVVTAVMGKRGTAALTVKAEKPRFTAAAAGQIKLPDVLGDSSTPYTNSSAPRRKNVERATALEDGWLVPPGGVFSYVQNVGKVDGSNGFVTGFGIVANENGGVTTAPVIGGGICQVSTTIFQAAFWAGMPIVERYQHPYWLLSYGEPPHGMKGLDAMVDIEDGYALDMKFRNATDNWIAVVLTADGNNVTAKILGTNPGWTVNVDGPKITNVVPEDDTMSYEDSSELPKGQELVVEHAQEGFDTEIDRSVTKGGQVIDDVKLTSSFLPSHNTTLRGTG